LRTAFVGTKLSPTTRATRVVKKCAPVDTFTLAAAIERRVARDLPRSTLLQSAGITNTTTLLLESLLFPTRACTFILVKKVGARSGKRIDCLILPKPKSKSKDLPTESFTTTETRETRETREIESHSISVLRNHNHNHKLPKSRNRIQCLMY
jgi:hypothetical protein